MGLFDKNYEKSSEDLYENAKQYIKSKDGKKHIVLLNTVSKTTTNGMECENKYTLQIDNFIEKMQNDGYEIIDIKFNSFQNLPGQTDGFHTLITYK